MTTVNPPTHQIINADLTSREGKKQLADLVNQLYVRTGGSTDLIQDLEVSQTGEDGGNRTYRRFRDEIDDLYSHIVQLKKQNRALEQALFEVCDRLDQTKRINRSTEQKVNEIIERVDSGT